ncbi:MAG: CobW family GTP-binding protein, partial [Planctomyces sp.]
MSPVPTSLITGFLGTGKTTSIRSLLQHRPADERWAVFINEYGMVSLDEALLDQPEGDSVQVQELAGGCFCCETADLFKPMLVQVMRRARPHRLLIEPSGAGHPAAVLDMLREGPFFRQHLDLRAVICIADPQDFDNPRTRANPVFHDQLEMADVVVINHVDHRDSDSTARFRQHLEQLDPPKLLIAQTTFGNLNPEWLDLQTTVMRQPEYPEAHSGLLSERAAAPAASPLAILSGSSPPQPVPAVPTPGQPVQLLNSGQGWWACGWLFSPHDWFPRHELLDLLEGVSGVQRLKG